MYIYIYVYIYVVREIGIDIDIYLYNYMRNLKHVRANLAWHVATWHDHGRLVAAQFFALGRCWLVAAWTRAHGQYLFPSEPLPQSGELFLQGSTHGLEVATASSSGSPAWPGRAPGPGPPREWSRCWLAAGLPGARWPCLPSCAFPVHQALHRCHLRTVGWPPLAKVLMQYSMYCRAQFAGNEASSCTFFPCTSYISFHVHSSSSILAKWPFTINFSASPAVLKTLSIQAMAVDFDKDSSFLGERCRNYILCRLPSSTNYLILCLYLGTS